MTKEVKQRQTYPNPPGVSKGTLRVDEYHPAADLAMAYMGTIDLNERVLLQEAFSSNAIEGNRLAEICAETLGRLMRGEGVSDRYLLGLAWVISSNAYRELTAENEALKLELAALQGSKPV